MKVINYVGCEGPCIVIQRPTDLYALIDWFHTQMVEISEGNSASSIEADSCAIFCSELMDEVELNGFGSPDDVENVEY